MDDGHLKQSENKPQKIILSTESFTNDEINKLIHFIWKMYSLTFRIDKQNRMILYDQFQIHYFLYLVTPFLHESMVRKTIDKCTIDFIVQPKRTTIYLPKTIKLTKPTREINKLLESLDYIIGQIRDGNFYTKYLEKSMYLQNNTTSYQIVITQRNLKRLYLIKEITGLSISASVELAFSV